MKKLISQILILIVAPSLVLYFIFNEGEKLAAPYSVKGVWAIHDNVVPAARDFCHPLLLPLDNPRAFISQSGQHLTVRFNDVYQTEMDGILNEDRLRLSTYVIPKKSIDISGCTIPLRIGLRAKFTQQEKTESLMGEIRVRNCEICPPIEFIATRTKAH